MGVGPASLPTAYDSTVSTPPRSSAPRGSFAAREIGFTLIAAAVALMVGAGVWLATRPPSPVAPQPAAAAAPATCPVAVVVDAARQLKLVTYSFKTTVDAAVLSDKWYGDATAKVRAPVRYQYGIDLDSLRADNVFYDAIGKRYVFVVAPPTRIAAEVDLAEMQSAIDVSGMRWKSQNLDQLERARKLLADRAKTMTLSPDDERKLTDASREQIEALLRRILAQQGEDAAVVVRFGK